MWDVASKVTAPTADVVTWEITENYNLIIPKFVIPK
jgi:hypothetical protein